MSPVTGLVPSLLEVNGIPAHPLVVHAAVVFIPLAVLGALVYHVSWWREWVRWPLLVVAVLAFVLVWAAYLTGDDFKESQSFFSDEATPLGLQIEVHEGYADLLRWVTTAFAVVVVLVAGWLHARRDVVKKVAVAAMGVLAVVTLVYVVLTGEAGAKAVYPPAGYDSSSVASGTQASQ